MNARPEQPGDLNPLLPDHLKRELRDRYADTTTPPAATDAVNQRHIAEAEEVFLRSLQLPYDYEYTLLTLTDMGRLNPDRSLRDALRTDIHLAKQYPEYENEISGHISVLVSGYLAGHYRPDVRRQRELLLSLASADPKDLDERRRLQRTARVYNYEVAELDWRREQLQNDVDLAGLDSHDYDALVQHKLMERERQYLASLNLPSDVTDLLEEIAYVHRLNPLPALHPDLEQDIALAKRMPNDDDYVRMLLDGYFRGFYGPDPVRRAEVAHRLQQGFASYDDAQRFCFNYIHRIDHFNSPHRKAHRAAYGDTDA